MFEANQAILARAEADAADGSAVGLLEHLRQMSIADFAELMWSLPNPHWPNISRVLPRMASEDAQRMWTGKAGTELRHHTVDFCRIVAMHFQAICGHRLDGERILDFGFGYGRIARVMYWFTNPERYFGVDPMEQSLATCRQDGVLGNLHHIDYMPDTIELGTRRFGLVFAYSVFTHTSLRATTTALRNLRRLVRNDGLLAITIRPIEHWQFYKGADQAAVLEEHRRDGFAFRSHGYVNARGEHYYGDNSMTLEWLEAANPEWEVRGHDRGLDPFQTIVFLQPR